MTDVVDVSTTTWVIEEQLVPIQVISEASTQVISELVNNYQVIDTTTATSEVITSSTNTIVEEVLTNSTQVDIAVTEVITDNVPLTILLEEKMPLATKVDVISDLLLYKGEAQPGTATSSAGWRIQKIVFTPDGTVEDIDITWANGNGSYDKIWDNRLSYSYS